MAFQIHDFLYVNILYFDIVYFSLYFSLKMAPLFLDRRRFFSMAFIIFLIWFKEYFPFGIYFSIWQEVLVWEEVLSSNTIIASRLLFVLCGFEWIDKSHLFRDIDDFKCGCILSRKGKCRERTWAELKREMSASLSSLKTGEKGGPRA